MLNRRQFMATGLLAFAMRPGAARAAATDPGEVLLNRLTFGATPEDRATLATMGPQDWLDDQLARPARDPEMDARLAGLRLRIAYEAGDGTDGENWPAMDQMRPLAALDADPASLLPLLDWDRPQAWDERVRPANEVIASSLPRAVHAPAQLREVMTQFWHDHFNVHAMKDEYSAVFFPQHDALLRDHALGNFRAMLGAVARSPAMLVYLNNAESRASPANENYARELLELHTLGAAHYLNDRYPRWAQVPGAAAGRAEGYIDEDVYEVARAFTGWTVGDGRWIADGVEAPMTGRFYYAQGWHDPYQKRILGHELPPNAAPMADAEAVLDLLATHPGTARHVCTKIARRLLTDDPEPGLVDRLATVFLDHAGADDQIARVIRALVADPDWAAPPTKLRRPFEFLAALYRASGAKVAAPEAAFHWQLTRAGWMQHTWPAPTGHPDRSADWSTGTALLRLVDMALYAHDDWFGCTTSRLSATAPDARTLGEVMAFWAERLHGTPGDGLPELLAGLGADAADPVPADAGSRHDVAAMALAFAALSPRFLLR